MGYIIICMIIIVLIISTIDYLNNFDKLSLSKFKKGDIVYFYLVKNDPRTLIKGTIVYIMKESNTFIYSIENYCCWIETLYFVKEENIYKKIN